MTASPSSAQFGGESAAALLLAPARPAIALRAILAVAFGLVALLRPDLTVLALAVAFGAYALVDGVARVVDAVRHRDRARWWFGVMYGLLGIAAGVIALVWPGITAVALAVVVGVWALVTGVVELIAAYRLRSMMRGVWLLALAGALSVVAGVLLVIEPVAGAIGLAVLIGSFAVIYGAVLAVVAMRLSQG
ncbi:HdeD family acid-resistance protein [Pseudonocardia bannensis]|uniref:HdeD family acid-resistance protein n=1 Tax=Pseudonocardia bannensis TaxID=630973 RepID=A0A848DJN3_9PSEU|nr:DUF308 domain-containing protein [Pseudonocardia bannensis]NMH92930.1 HdeD family acid-resistance protein [Pseudonocardia bannensis]